MFPTTRALVIAAMIGVAQLAGHIGLFVKRETVVSVIVAGVVGLLVGVLMLFVRREAGVAAVIGGALAILTGCSLLLMALPEDPAVVLILAPPILGGTVALLNPGSRWALGGSMLLVLGGA
jgi:hypothetical protein